MALDLAGARRTKVFFEVGEWGDRQPRFQPAGFDLVEIKADGTDWSVFVSPVGIADASLGLTEKPEQVNTDTELAIRHEGFVRGVEFFTDISADGTDNVFGLHFFGPF